jgi:Nucleoside 2-deoxyribosyltransferase
VNSLYSKEGLYIAGPECFYENGYELWWAQRKLAEYYGIPVVLPTSTPLKLDNSDKRLNAKEIFDDLVVQVKRTTAIIADLDAFRSPEPDCGTVFELGWIHSREEDFTGIPETVVPLRQEIRKPLSGRGKSLMKKAGSTYMRTCLIVLRLWLR